MPEIVTESCSEYVRSSGPNAIKAAFKKSKGTGHAFYATGMRNVTELAFESQSGDEKPIVRKQSTRVSFGDIMAQARGTHDVVTQEKKKGDKTKKERPYARADTPHLGAPVGACGSLKMNRASEASGYGNQYQLENPHISHQPLGIIDTSQLPALLSMSRRNHQTNQSEVSLCDHKNFVIYWDPDDPCNRNGSFIARIADCEETFQTAQATGHYRRKDVNVEKMAIEMATEIINKFNKEENEWLTGQDRQRKFKEPRRLPTHSILLREVHNMYSQLFRNKHSQLAKTKEALRMKLGAGERRKELAEKTQLEAQRSRQCCGTAKARNNNNLEGSDKPDSASDSSPSRGKKKTPKQIAREKVARNKERRGMTEIARICAEPLDRFKPSTVEKQQAQEARARKQVRRERATKSKFSQKLKSFVTVTDAEEDDETAATRRATKATRRPARRISDSDNNCSEEEVVKKRKFATKLKSRRMTRGDRALLASIAQAEQEEREKYTRAETEVAQEETSEPEPALSKAQKEAAFFADIAAIERAQLAAHEKCKSVVVDESIADVRDEKIDGYTEVVEARTTAMLVEPLAEKIEHTANVGDKSELPPPPMQTPKLPTSSASRVSKRKNSFPDAGEELSSFSTPPFSRPIKKARQNDFLKNIVPTVEQDRKSGTPPAIAVESVKDSMVVREIFSND
ncbi:uncharacterized protein ALTATR162_LOCUS11917 [Alternaria atra]|uniref:Uncharacterized protein n=1 Tax=Alternaria atra TaxID=119953 RepID=A0A8J2N7Z6_9PLEO|nr:uncharacterized protein ALTATR162_LOCUS11917 [Alternaria atra]CAG5188275.1 unnamed protein product [Alternaria atra]